MGKPNTTPYPDLANPDYVNRSLAIACTRGREAVVVRFRDIFHRQDFSEQQWRVLRILFDQGAMTATDICKQSCIHKVSMSRILKSLEKRDFVERSTSECDNRSALVQLTQQGVELLDPLVEEAAVIHREITREFGPEKYQLLLTLLRELAEINETPRTPE
ncbi:MarR family transcriptional regulator [Antarcticimicrobium sediminis]|nr:MarR family transcriptional regulator [Antarcticimicrobium sediminis]